MSDPAITTKCVGEARSSSTRVPPAAQSERRARCREETAGNSGLR
jgi:hypothetical protein